MNICVLFIWFVLYSVLGWAYESAFCTIQSRHWHNRGILFSPCCPIYGAGAVLDVLICTRLTAHPAAVFFLCMAGSAVLEYATSLFLEKFLHVSCWDYSMFPLNLKGRICLPASFCFGVGGLLVLYVLQPGMVFLTGYMPDGLIQPTALLLMALLAADTALTASRHAAIDRHIITYKEVFDAHMEKTCQTVAGHFHDDAV